MVGTFPTYFCSIVKHRLNVCRSPPRAAQLKFNKGCDGGWRLRRLLRTHLSSLAGVTRGPGRGALPALFPFLISSLDSLASLISRYPVQCYPCYLTQFDEKSRKCFVFQTIAWPGLGCGERQELLLKNDSQTSLILFLFPKINEKGSLEKAES